MLRSRTLSEFEEETRNELPFVHSVIRRFEFVSNFESPPIAGQARPWLAVASGEGWRLPPPRLTDCCSEPNPQPGWSLPAAAGIPKSPYPCLGGREGFIGGGVFRGGGVNRGGGVGFSSRQFCCASSLEE
jgi:hypothetical protein